MTHFVVAIDATRCKSGGAVAHLRGILSACDPRKFGIREVHLISNKLVLAEVGTYSWLHKHEPRSVHWPVSLQVFWQTFFLKRLLNRIKTDVLFSADASTFCRWPKHVVLHQDLLAFEPGVSQLYRSLGQILRIKILRYAQIFSLKHATAAIFLTEYAKELLRKFSVDNHNSAVVQHGVDSVFRETVRAVSYPLKSAQIVYVSNAAPYKNHLNVVRATSELRRRGHDVHLTLVGAASGVCASDIASLVREVDSQPSFIKLTTFASQGEVVEYLKGADVFVFASLCETLPVTLLEAMAAGVPVACSRSGPMPEVLGDCGVYFDALDYLSIADGVEAILVDDDLRHRLSASARARAGQFTWASCAERTWKLLSSVV